MRILRAMLKIGFLQIATIAIASLCLAQSPGHQNKASTTLSRDSLKRIKAVLVLGPSTGSSIEDVEQITKIAIYLREKGVQVTELYDPHATWKGVVSASHGAHIFLYSGHGTFLGVNGKPGGLCLSGEQRINSSTISKELKLHKTH